MESQPFYRQIQTTPMPGSLNRTSCAVGRDDKNWTCNKVLPSGHINELYSVMTECQQATPAAEFESIRR
jgi:hypothetical protein